MQGVHLSIQVRREVVRRCRGKAEADEAGNEHYRD
jgi:hypothetical protein